MSSTLSTRPLAAARAQVPFLSPAPASESPASAFDAVLPPLRAALEARGFSELTSVQAAVLAAEVEGRDLQISSQTGSGKTVALGFVLAAAGMEGPAPAEARTKSSGDPADPAALIPFSSGPAALIIVPTRELASQVCEELGWLFAGLPGVEVAAVTGGTPLYKDRQILKRRPRILVGTPGRLLDHVRSGVLELGGVRQLVLDEADQMLDMGFREELEGILDATPTTRRTHLVSATFPVGIQRLAERYQRDPVAIEGTRLGDANLDIEHVGHLVAARDRYAALVNLLLQVEGERTLVFVQRRADALEVASRLEADGFAALPLSGELVQAQRDRTLNAFRAGRATVLVATDVAARGLDVSDIGTVIHTALPIDAQAYTHRSGRTGRAGKAGRSVLLAAPSHRRKVARLMSQAGIDLRWLPTPSAAQVEAELTARARQGLEAELEAALAAGPSAEHLAHAKELLGGREAAPVVAALLARLQPAPRVAPQQVEVQRDEPRAAAAEARRPVRDRSANPKQRGRFGTGNSVRFFMNRGANQGANPSRLLALICRRGEVDGACIGSIAIHPNASTFDVRADVAERFEHLAGRHDPRDPQVLIRRDRGPQPGARPHRKGPFRA